MCRAQETFNPVLLQASANAATARNECMVNFLPTNYAAPGALVTARSSVADTAVVISVAATSLF